MTAATTGAAPEPPVFDAAFRAQFDTLLRWRRDVRAFRRGPVPEPVFREILDSAAFAPSVGNSQPWRVVRCRTPALRERLAAHVDAANATAAASFDDPARAAAYRRLRLHGLRDAPEVLAVFSDDDPAAGHRLGRATMNETLRYSTVIAVHHLWLAARVRGVGLGWVSILDPGCVSACLDVPDDWTFVALLCLGYPDDASDTPELERRDWQARAPLRVFTR